jgi:hypothetical protein
MKLRDGVALFTPDASMQQHAHRVADGEVTVMLRAADGTESPAPDALGAIVRSVAGSLAAGRRVWVTDEAAMVSPTVAAQMLGVSRPMVTKWVEEGLLDDDPVGSHHRIPVASVIELRNRRADAGKRALGLMESSEKDPAVAARVEGARSRARQRISARSPG